MKKSFYNIVSFLLFVLSANNTIGQSLNEVRREFIVADIGAINSNVDSRAARNFSKAFKNVHDESWSRKEDGYRARFVRDGIKYMVDYDMKGNWTSTIRIYDEAKLAATLRRAVKMEYFDYSIVKVIELRIGKVTAHFVKMEDRNSLKTIRLMDDRMDVVEAYKKG